MKILGHLQRKMHNYKCKHLCIILWTQGIVETHPCIPGQRSQENNPIFINRSINHIVLNKHLMCTWYLIDAQEKSNVFEFMADLQDKTPKFI